MKLVKQLNLYNAFKKDKSAAVLVFSNTIVIIFALTQNWNLLILMLGYWLQSVIIGFFNFVKIVSLKEFSVKGLKINNKKVEATKKTKMSVAFFFVLHYGFFHLVYFGFFMGFIAENQDLNLTKEISSILIMGIIFFFNHLFSFWYNKGEFKEKKPNIGKIMLFPYARIIPMHLTVMAYVGFIIFSSIAGFELYFIPLILFLFFKTMADLIMHIIEHQGFEDAEQRRFQKFEVVS